MSDIDITVGTCRIVLRPSAETPSFIRAAPLLLFNSDDLTLAMLAVLAAVQALTGSTTDSDIPEGERP